MKKQSGHYKKDALFRKEKPSNVDNRKNSYWLYGIHAVEAVLNNRERKVNRIIAVPQIAERLAGVIAQRSLITEIVTTQYLTQLLPMNAVHQGIAVEVKPLIETSLEEYLFQTRDNVKPVLVLDQVTDPHNIGAMLRSSAAFSAGAVITTKDNSPSESSVMAKSSSGGIEIVPLIHVTNLVQSLKLLKKNGYWCVGLEGKARQTIAEAKLDKNTAFILGGEGKGLRRLTAENCDLMVRLPISSLMESLNVSNAAAIALYELTCKKAI